MKKIINSLIVTLVLSFTAASNATLLSVQLEGGGTYDVGETITANVFISDIEQIFGVNNLVGAFEFSLMFDDSLMSFSNGVFGTGLDVDPLFPSEQDITVFGNYVMVSETTFGFFDDLEAAQRDEFLLSSISFVANSAGAATLSINDILLSDDVGLLSTFNNVSSQGTSLTINAGPQAVPEPSSIWLFAASLLIFAGLRQRLS